MTDPLIHIGYHKTATSLLQGKLFANRELGFHLPSVGRKGIQQAFVARHALDPSPDELIEALHAEHAEAEERGGTLVLSHERLSGYPASGGFDQVMIARRLQRAFPDGKVVVVIREQRQMLFSMYLQTITDGSPLSLRRFLSRTEPDLMRKPAFDFSYLAYDRLITLYRELFGAERVHVVAFEAFSAQPDKHARALLEYALGPEKAVRYSDGSLSRSVNRARPLAFQALRRRLNLLIRNQLNDAGLLPLNNRHIELTLRRLMPIFEPLRPFDSVLKRRLESRIARACDGRYAASNIQTAQMTGIDLAALGYDVSE
ncbi:MAG: sulfotransferase [Pseudomonadota bacterium]